MKRIPPLVQRAVTVLVGLIVAVVAVKIPKATWEEMGAVEGRMYLFGAGIGLVMWAMKHFADAKEKEIAVARATGAVPVQPSPPDPPLPPAV